ncbi:MAG TPA: 50S ribosomal protein L25 [Acidimicrobiales bacterium]|nr:50S ribosomal protein L25 [Acidimicrobiales bacterium]
MSEDLVLVAETGRETGTRPSRRMRREGNVPATLYGLGKDAETIAVAWRELRRVLTTDAGVNAFIHLEVDGRRQATLVKEIQRHPVRRDVIHVDFLRVDPKVTLDVEVAIELTGEAEGVTRAGGIVQQLLHALIVSTRPDNIPNSLELDVSELTLNGDLRVRDLVLPAGVTTDVDPDEVVAQGLITSAGASGETAEAAEAAEAAPPTESAES